MISIADDGGAVEQQHDGSH